MAVEDARNGDLVLDRDKSISEALIGVSMATT